MKSYTYYRQYGNRIFFRYKLDEGSETKSKIVDFYQPKLWTTSTDGEFSTIYDQKVKPTEFAGIKEAKEFVEQYKNVSNFNIHGNSNYANQFIIELFQGQSPKYDAKTIRRGFLDIEVDGVKEDGTREFPDPKEHKYPINAITIHDSIDDTFYTFALKHHVENKWDQKYSPEIINGLNVKFDIFDREVDLLMSFLTFMQTRAFDVTSGWNSEGFDMPYLVFRCFKIVGQKTTEKCLSPFGVINIRDSYDQFGNDEKKITILGMPHIDYMLAYKKHTYNPRESYKLDFIAHAELGEKKLSYEESGDLIKLYRDNFQLFVDYNIQDVNLMVRLDARLGLFGLIYAMSYYTLSNFEDAMGTTKIWEQLVAKYLYNNGKVPPFKKQNRETREFEGAWVKEPTVGFSSWIKSFDLKSLYPHIEQEWNIGPDTHVPFDELPDELKAYKSYKFDDILNMRVDTSLLKKHNLTMAANGEFYRRDKMSFFSAIKRDLYNQRKAEQGKMKDAEKEQNKYEKGTPEYDSYDAIIAMFDNMQLGLKVLLNGGYGALGNVNFLYYMVENAEAITLSGQFVNRYCCNRLNETYKKLFDPNFNYWIYSDTDSGYFSMQPYVDQYLQGKSRTEILDAIDAFTNRVGDKEMAKYTQELCDYVNGYENRMFYNREVIAERGVFIAKKKYVLSVWDKEGIRYREPKYKIMGMESVKSSTPEWSRNLLKECYIIALEKDEKALQERFKSIEKEFYRYDINTIAIPRGINGINKYKSNDEKLYIKGTPKHVKGVIVHNHLVDKLNLSHVEKITEGNKIKYVSLKMPNKTGQQVIAFDTYLPKEFGIEDAVDYSEIFEKSFASALRIFLTSVGWSEEPKNDLNALLF